MPAGSVGTCKGAGVLEYKESLPFYHTLAWKRARAAALQRDQGMCAECMRQFRAGYGIRPRRAEMVHHIVPVKERPDLALELDNLQSLCYMHHEQLHPEKRENRERETPLPLRRLRVEKV